MLKLHEVTIAYPDSTVAIDRVSFTLCEGDNIALIGENGAGKTTLLLAIVGILEAVHGTIDIGGISLNRKTVQDIRKSIGLVFQNPDDQLFMPYVYDDVAFGCRSHGLPEDEVRARVEDTLARLHIGHLSKRSSLKLSGGEKRIAAIATVLAMEPSILLFDEPTAFLDPKAKRALIETLSYLPHPKIIATHDMDFASRICNRAIVVKGGCIVADGEAAAILDDEALLRECGL